MPDPDARLDDLLSAVIVPALPEGLFVTGAPTDVALDDPWPETHASCLWCVDYLALQARFPGLPQSHDEDEDAPHHGCADLIVETDEHGRLECADFELHSLPETFEQLGDHASATRARALYGRPAREAAYGLASLLVVMFEAGRDPGATRA